MSCYLKLESNIYRFKFHHYFDHPLCSEIWCFLRHCNIALMICKRWKPHSISIFCSVVYRNVLCRITVILLVYSFFVLHFFLSSHFSPCSLHTHSHSLFHSIFGNLNKTHNWNVFHFPCKVFNSFPKKKRKWERKES